MKYAILFLVLTMTSLQHCSASRPDADEKPAGGHPQVVIRVDDDVFWKEDRCVVDSLAIKDDLLTIFASYSGGCAEHEFMLIAGSQFENTSPSPVEIILAHDAHGDMCEAWVPVTLHFDLTPLKQSWRSKMDQSHGELSMRFPDLEQPVEVVYRF